ncbi:MULTISPECIES: glycosyltransferase [Pseudomonas]|uniref:glycosyltransferase n=1 Tax=Pseudomonas TaxID=286 RepID=UPI000CC3BF01|nr:MULTISPECIES: glycosyltransferase [Pseudomonas]EKT4504265.1 glycosyltransferase [Pseudomonas putida]PKF25735.1 glycosyl transferase family 1 [Pseudomonas hunanensis]QNG08286.1 glycosyltransferase [Pseudomonas putida]HDS1059465.1 glycosyltransferase [Pseudomonas putida]
MRIVIDMQGAQTESRFRGIGRYTLSFAQGIVRNRGQHEVFLVLNGLFAHTIEGIREAFQGLLPQENIRVWYAPGPVQEIDPNNASRRQNAELIREAFLASLNPDIVHITSLFEGYIDDAVSSVGLLDSQVPVTVSLYDLIPLLNPDHYLKPNPGYEQYYMRKVGHLQRASGLLAISGFARQETLDTLEVSAAQVVNVSTAIDDHFQPCEVSPEDARALQAKFALDRPFVLYTGGADERKNLPRLIQAFAKLDGSLRDRHQLLFAGKMSEGDRMGLMQEARKAGLREDELRFTNYVTELELVQLYNLCELFVFPSWHEGFGLPALEAMACGAPVIAANTSSLPEVIGLDSALFDPLDVASITAKMTEALGNDAFLQAQRAHALQQARKFSWDQTARRAVEAFEAIVAGQATLEKKPHPGVKPRLAFVSPLPPERTGIADYSAELLPALAEYYDITLVVVQDRYEQKWPQAGFAVHDAQWLLDNAHAIDRVVYQMGNSPYHDHMLTLMQEVPGTVVLHDFYMSGLMGWREEHAGYPYDWVKALYAGHGYMAVAERYQDADAARLKYPVNLHALQYAQGLIVHSDYSRQLAQQWYSGYDQHDWQVIPLLREPALQPDKAQARRQLGLGEDDFVVCSFGFLDPSKLNHQMLDAWFASPLAQDKRCKLVFVGDNHGGAYGQQLLEAIRRSGHADAVTITGYASRDTFQQYLQAADMAVQLRTSSRGETSAAALDCMNYGLPLVVNANGSMAELDAEAVWLLPDECSTQALVEALTALRNDPQLRTTLGNRARSVIHEKHAPGACAQAYFHALEGFRSKASAGVDALVGKIAHCNEHLGKAELQQLSQCIAYNMPLMRPQRRVFLDVTATCRTDLKTGIERVARAITLALLETPPAGYRVEPVYLSDKSGGWNYHYARHFTLGMLGLPHEWAGEERVDPLAGDLLVGLDLSGDTLVQATTAGLIQHYRDTGVGVWFMLHDLLPLRIPHVFPPGTEPGYAQWLKTLTDMDGVVAVSKAVADDLSAWVGEQGLTRNGPRALQIDWSHHGADLANAAPSKGMPASAQQTMAKLRARPTFLLVGTVEPRKSYLQALKAFELLWEQGVDVNLAIVGGEGWKALGDEARRDIPETVTRLRGHAQQDQRLFWLTGISDEYLENVYASSTCLVFASVGEGFGLPLIEAAQHGLPILARDIPVFREVALDHAYYFSGEQPEDLARSVQQWLGLFEQGQHPRSQGMPSLTWAQSARRLLEIVLERRLR